MNKQTTEKELQITYNHKEKCLASFKINKMQGVNYAERSETHGEVRGRDLGVQWVSRWWECMDKVQSWDSEGRGSYSGFQVAMMNEEDTSKC